VYIAQVVGTFADVLNGRQRDVSEAILAERDETIHALVDGIRDQIEVFRHDALYNFLQTRRSSNAD